MKTNKFDELSVRILKVINSIFLTLTIVFGVIFGINFGDNFVDSSVDVITPMLYFMVFGIFTLMTRSKE